MSNNRDKFPPKVVMKAAERAAYICSNPSCHRTTIGPVESDDLLSTKTGEAAHICGRMPSAPRYDMSQTSAQRMSITNAIWLCGTCADLIDKNNGVDYPVTHLHKWKKDHEKLMKECLEGARKVAFHQQGASAYKKAAERTIHILEDRRFLFQRFDQEDPRFVIESIKEIRTMLTAIRGEIEQPSALSEYISSILKSCRHYMSTISVCPTFDELNYSLGALRKAIGVIVNDMVRDHNISISDELRSIIPE